MIADGMSRRTIGQVMGALTLVHMLDTYVTSREITAILMKRREIKRRKVYLLKEGVMEVSMKVASILQIKKTLSKPFIKVPRQQDKKD